VRANSLTVRATDFSIEHEIKEWLKFANERDGGRKLRELKKHRQRADSVISHPADRPDEV
jgi:hypothetical protein